MKRPLALIAGAALLALGVWSAVALGAGNDQRETSTVATTTTGETTDTTTGETTDTTTGQTTDTTTGQTTDTTTGQTTDTTTGETTDTTTGQTTDTTTERTSAAAASKVWVCHHTGSWKHPYHLIHISTHALHAHVRNVDVLPGANNACPTTQPADAKTHGHGKGRRARPSGHGNDGQNEATETNDD
jgi:hypothetical protein